MTVVCAIGACAAIVAARAPDPRAYRPDDHYRLRSVNDVQLSPDGSTVAFVERFIDGERRNRSQIWLLTVADKKLRRLSAEDADDNAPRWSPDSRSLAYLTGRRAVSNSAGFLPTAFGSQIAVVRVDGGAPEIVAEFKTSNHPLAYQGGGEQMTWAPDGSALAFLSADEGPEGPPGDPMVVTRYGYKSWASMTDNRRWHIYVVTLADKKVRALTSGTYQDHSIAWSPKGDEIAYISNHEPDPDRVHNYDIFAVRVSDARVRQITKTKGCEYAPAWSPDGSSIAYLAGVRPLTTQESSAEDPHVWVIPAAGGTGRQLAASLDRRAMSIGWAAGEQAIYFTVQDHGSTHLYRVGADDRDLKPVLSDTGQVSAWSSAKGQRIAYAFHGTSAPAEVFLKSGGSPAQLTSLNAEIVGARDVSTPEPFEFSSFDGTRVQGFLTPPLRREPGRKYPVILNIHGGPHGQQGPSFVHKSQVYAGEGYATVMVNYRGSSGYGQKFTDGTVNDQNGSEYKDVAAGLDYILAKTPYLDADRVGVEGGSYGGQLTNWAITQTTRFKSAIPSAGISNLLSHGYLIWAQDYTAVEWGGRHAWQDDVAKRMWERSALAYVAKVRTPTMFIHGELDQDVPIQEAEQMYIALKQVGVEAVLVRYPREGHGLREPAHVVDALVRSLAWHGRFLKPENKSSQN
jgi:dipeptidyl aminopeptidase/acylaminoacyl peptidase